MDVAKLSTALDQCLLTDEEMALEPMGWLRFPDPFGPWDEQVAA